jgi:UDPglucose 6-dehydrogenase
MGNKVWCVDVDQSKIAKLNQDIIPIYEPGLQEMVVRNVKEKRLFFTTDLSTGLKTALFCFIAVGTPPAADGSADLSYVFAATRSIGQLLDHYTIIINKSTVPVGTADRVREIIQAELQKRALKYEFDIVSNPEFLKEGVAIEDFMRPDRVIIGTDNVRTAELMKQLYEPFTRNQHPILVMDIRSAEITKYAANAMLATRISFMNEIARLCDQVGGDIAHVRQGIGSDSRIGMSFLYAGCGYGGSCFPKDVKELISTGHKNSLPMHLISATEQVNAEQKYYLVEMVKRRFGTDLSGMVFGAWGLAFKPQTDDLREAPALIIIEALIKMGAKIQAYDPVAMENAKKILNHFESEINYFEDMLETLEQADALILITEWRQFRQVDLAEIKGRMRHTVIFDGRNQYQPSIMKSLGFEYYCVGRNNHEQQ